MLGFLPFTHTTRVEILCTKIKTIKSDVVRENDRLQSTCNSAEQPKKSRKIAPPQITAHIFWSFLTGMARTIWFSHRNFRFSYVNNKYLWYRTEGASHVGWREDGGWEDGGWGGGDNNPRFRILDGLCWRYRENLERVDFLLLKKLSDRSAMHKVN